MASFDEDEDSLNNILLQPVTDEKLKAFTENGYGSGNFAFDEVTNYVLDGESDKTRGYTSQDLISRTLHQLARDGNHMLLAMAIERLGDQAIKRVNQLDQDHLAPLHYAARYAHPYTVKTLLQRNAKINIKGVDDLTPLHFAARYRKPIISAARKRKKLMRLSRDETLYSYSESISPLLSKETSQEEISEVAPTENEIQETEEEKTEPLEDEEEKVEPVEDDEVNEEELPVDVFVDEERREPSVIRILVENGADLEAKDIYGLTPLHFAAMRGNDVAARDLLEHDINIEARDKQQMTPLFIASTYGYIDICQRLIYKGAELLAVDENNQTALHRAAAEGHLKIIALLLNASSKSGGSTTMTRLLSMKDDERQTPLFVAVVNGNIQTVRLLLEKGADVNSVRDTLASPLHASAVVGDPELIEMLIQNGANVEAVDSNQQTALHKAAASNQPKAVKTLLKHGAKIEKRDRTSFTPLLEAASCGHPEVIKILLGEQANVEAVDKDDKTAVYWCAEQGNVEALKVLLDDSDCLELIDFSDRLDNSPLHEAAMKGHLDCLKVLLDNGSQIDNKNEDEETALHIAAEEGQTEVVKELINRYRFLINDENEDANTPLHLASLEGHEDVVRILLEAGAEVEARNTNLWTPLDCCSAKGHEAVCQLLIEYDAPLDPLDKTKTTPLQLAAKNGHVAVINLLLAKGADVAVVDSDSRNALELSIAAGQKDVAMAIVRSDKWLHAIRNVRFDEAGKKITPFRQLIKKFPDVAQVALDRCITTNGLDSEQKDFGIKFNYEFLDDTYTIPSQDNDDSSTSIGSLLSENPYKEDGKLFEEAEPYTDNQRLLKSNHPLMLMVKYRRTGLLSHPVSVSIVKQKWNSYARYIYYFNLIFYSVFLAFLTAYVTNSTDWNYVNYLIANDDTVNFELGCSNLEEHYELGPNTFTTTGKYVIIIMAALNILREIFQFYQARLNYIGIENLLEWICYLGALALVIDWGPDPECSIRKVWQWQVGSVAIFLAWINLVLFLRKLPLFGIYVVMFTDVCVTFSRFFIVFFLFIVGFALGFYMVFRTQLPFSTVGKSLIKTSVMMIGEFEFDTIFNNPEQTLLYPAVSNLLFTGFLILMSILIMNLLVGLAVDDIKGVQDNAVLKRRAMQAQLIMDVEVLIPEALRRKFAISYKKFFPNEKRMRCKKIFSDFNMLYLFDYAEINNKTDQQQEMDRRMDELSAQIKELKIQNQKMYNLFTASIAFNRKSKYDRHSTQATENP